MRVSIAKNSQWSNLFPVQDSSVPGTRGEGIKEGYGVMALRLYVCFRLEGPTEALTAE